MTDGALSIAPATLTVTTPNATRPYDGTALTAEGSLSGLVPGETATLVTTGSQTGVGSSANTYTLDWDGSAEESNYTVEEDLGTLTVTAPANMADQGASGDVAANGGSGTSGLDKVENHSNEETENTSQLNDSTESRSSADEKIPATGDSVSNSLIAVIVAAAVLVVCFLRLRVNKDR